MSKPTTPPTNPSVSIEVFGQMPDGIPVYEYTLENQHGMSVKIINYGAIIRECAVPNSRGEANNVVLGFPKLAQYIAKHPRFGSTIGRYANRIAGSAFELGGTTYKLRANNGLNSIHGGLKGFDKRVWKALETGENEQEAWVILNYLSKDMEEGFPGNLDVSVKFALSHNNNLSLTYSATSDKATPLNLTNHSYFNLKGAGKGNILEHIAKFQSHSYTVLDEASIPTGEIKSVENTAFDFRNETAIGAKIGQISGGYDINMVVDGGKSRPEKESGNFNESQHVAIVHDPESGRTLNVYTDQPGFQFFTANGLDGSISGNGGNYDKHAGFCIETQHFADSVHHKEFPNTILQPGRNFHSKTDYSFT